MPDGGRPFPLGEGTGERSATLERTGRPTIRRPTAILALLTLAIALVAAGCGSVAKPQGWAAPVVRDDIVYTSHDAGKLGAYRLDQQARLWEFPQKGDGVKLSGIYGTPALDGDLLYLAGYGGDVAAVSTADGRPRWVHKAGSRVIGGVLLAGETVYAGTDGGELVALNRDDGSERWRRKAGNEIWATPLRSEDLIIVATMDGRVVAYGQDGGEVWRQRPTGAAIAGTPALVEGRLYLGSLDRQLYALDARTGETLWRTERAGDWFWTEPLVARDTVYAGNFDGRVYAFDRATGARRWASEVGTQIRARTALVDDVLVVAARDGFVYGLRPASGERVWGPVEVGGKLLADLVASPRGLFISSEVGKKSHRLFRIDAATGGLTEAPLAIDR